MVKKMFVITGFKTGKKEPVYNAKVETLENLKQTLHGCFITSQANFVNIISIKEQS